MKKTILALALGLSLVAGRVAQADTISFNFSGQWDSVTSPSRLDPWFSQDEAFGGTIDISYNLGATASSNADGSVSYAGESLTFTTTKWKCTVTAPEINIYYDSTSGGSVIDQFVIHFLHRSGSVNFPRSPGLAALPLFLSGDFGLKDDQQNVLSGTGLPSFGSMASWLPLFDSGRLNFYFSSRVNPDNAFDSPLIASGRIDIHPTPEPATFFLFAIGLTALAAYRRRQDH